MPICSPRVVSKQLPQDEKPLFLKMSDTLEFFVFLSELPGTIVAWGPAVLADVVDVSCVLSGRGCM